MTDKKQILAGMNELIERLQNAEAPATEAERQAQATQQEFTRWQAGVKGKGKVAEVPLQQEQGIGAFASKYQPQPFEGEDDKWREWARVFRSWFGRFLVVRWQKSTNTLRNTVTIQQPSWTWRSRF